jgi:hypothetical protein
VGVPGNGRSSRPLPSRVPPPTFACSACSATLRAQEGQLRVRFGHRVAVERGDVCPVRQRDRARDARHARRSFDCQPAVDGAAQLRLRAGDERRERRQVEPVQRQRERQRHGRVHPERAQRERQRAGDEHAALGERRFRVEDRQRPPVVTDVAEHARDRERRVTRAGQLETECRTRLGERAADARVRLQRAGEIVVRALGPQRRERFGDVGRLHVQRERDRLRRREAGRAAQVEAHEAEIERRVRERDARAVAARVHAPLRDGETVDRTVGQRRVAVDDEMRPAPGDRTAAVDLTDHRRGDPERRQPGGEVDVLRASDRAIRRAPHGGDRIARRGDHRAVRAQRTVSCRER